MAAAKKTVIRNMMWVPQNLRFGDDKKDKVELNRRGERGDVASITVDQKDTTAFKMGLGRFFEEITQSEADKIIYEQMDAQNQRYMVDPVTGQRLVERGIVTEQEQLVGPPTNIYTDPRTGKIYQRVGPVGPRAANVPGADPYYQQVFQQQPQVPGVNSVEMPLPTKGRVDTPIEKGNSPT